ncbi:hypothetical protein BDZ94DRAFT_1359429 [Collybia nuda]|uniref:Secreted protein n=1 Tax=Collybia nuda TaxID=64659 RepID=A0A9P5Y7X9_9AGAR|nr:hypothetical protein BDZ94DRAFT_1359429 [Collybia nuda]
MATHVEVCLALLVKALSVRQSCLPLFLGRHRGGNAAPLDVCLPVHRIDNPHRKHNQHVLLFILYTKAVEEREENRIEKSLLGPGVYDIQEGERRSSIPFSHHHSMVQMRE